MPRNPFFCNALTQPTSKREATNGRDGVYQLGRRAYQQRHQRKPFHYDTCSVVICSVFLRQIPSKPSPSTAGVVAGNTDILLAAPHRTTVCLSSATSSSFKNTQLTASYLSFYKDQRTNPNPDSYNDSVQIIREKPGFR